MEKKMMLASGKCPWECYFCGYGREKEKKRAPEELKEQIDNYFKGFKPGKIKKLKVDIHGSLLNPEQVPSESRCYLAKKVKEYGIEELVIESRPEYINRKNLMDFQDINLTVGVGLEVADDHYLRRLNKGFTVSDYENSTQIADAMGVDIKTYVLVNPPFIDDVKGMVDQTVREALRHSDGAVLINCYPHEGTPLEERYREGEWEPLSKEEFFDLTKDWLVHPKVEYDVRQKEVPPTWKAWIPRFSDEEEMEEMDEEALINSKYEMWQKFLRRKYNPPEDKEIALIMPDSKEKPYRKSELHKEIYRSLKDLKLEESVHRLVVSSPGIVPIEFDGMYPFESYRWDEEGMNNELREEYIEVTKERVKKYFAEQRLNYNHYILYFKPGSPTEKAVKKALEELNIPFDACLQKGELMEEESLDSLENILKETGV